MEFMKDKPDNFYDLAVVDPPYGIGITAMNMGSRKTVKPDKSKSWDNEKPTAEYFDELFRISNNQIIWGGNYFNLPISQYFAIWDKGETMYGRDFAECEYAWVRSGGTRLLKLSPNQLQRIHPTQKPVALYKWLLTNYAKPGYKLLDTHSGSGSFRIACHNMGYNLDSCELDEDYYNANESRYQQHIQQNELFSKEAIQENIYSQKELL